MNFVYRQDELASHGEMYNTLDFLQNTSTRHDIPHILVQTRECLCECKAKSMLYPSLRFIHYYVILYNVVTSIDFLL